MGVGGRVLPKKSNAMCIYPSSLSAIPTLAGDEPDDSK